MYLYNVHLILPAFLPHFPASLCLPPYLPLSLSPSLSLSLPSPPLSLSSSTDQLMLTKVFHLKRRVHTQCSLNTEVFVDSCPLPHGSHGDEGEEGGLRKNNSFILSITRPSEPPAAGNNILYILSNFIYNIHNRRYISSCCCNIFIYQYA